MKLYKKPTSANFYARFYLQGREYKTSCSTSVRRDAEAFARAWRTKIEAEVAAGRKVAAAVPLQALRDKDVARARDARRSELYIARSITGRFDNHLTPFFRYADAVTDDSLEAYVNHRRAQGARAQTITTELENLKRSLRLCRIRGPEFWPKLAADDPDTAKASKRHARETWQTWVCRLRGEAFDVGLFALLTGLRWAELYRAQPGDVLPVEGYSVITVREKVKRKRNRQVVLSMTAQEIAERLPFKHDHRKAFAVAQQGLPSGNITLRDCRAAFSTAAGSVDARMADLMLGHSGVPARYIKQDYDRMWAAVCGVESWLTGPAGPVLAPLITPHTSEQALTGANDV